MPKPVSHSHNHSHIHSWHLNDLYWFISIQTWYISYIYIYPHIYIYIHTSIYIYTYTCMYIYIYIWTYLYIYIISYKRICIHRYMRYRSVPTRKNDSSNCIPRWSSSTWAVPTWCSGCTRAAWTHRARMWEAPCDCRWLDWRAWWIALAETLGNVGNYRPHPHDIYIYINICIYVNICMYVCM